MSLGVYTRSQNPIILLYLPCGCVGALPAALGYSLDVIRLHELVPPSAPDSTCEHLEGHLHIRHVTTTANLHHCDLGHPPGLTSRLRGCNVALDRIVTTAKLQLSE